MKSFNEPGPTEHELIYLTAFAKEISDETYEIAKYILDDERFPKWSGSGHPHQHHYGYGGLMRHTYEVMELCFMMKSGPYQDHDIDPMELYLAVLFHDSGKMYDYERIPEEEICDPEDNFWRPTKHKRLIHHISRSAVMWTEASSPSARYFIKQSTRDNVLHAILAHHTKREHGSPVAPKTRVAWLLTLCDNMSARMDDADTWDIIKRPQTF